MNDGKPEILAQCTGKSPRSQMAELLIPNHVGNRFNMAGAGTRGPIPGRKLTPEFSEARASGPGRRCLRGKPAGGS